MLAKPVETAARTAVERLMARCQRLWSVAVVQNCFQFTAQPPQESA